MDTLIVAGGEVNLKQLDNYCKKHKRSNYDCC